MSAEIDIEPGSPTADTPQTPIISLTSASAEVVDIAHEDVITVDVTVQDSEGHSEGRHSEKWEMSAAEPFTWESIFQRPCFYFPLFFLNLSGWFGAIGLLCVWAGVSALSLYVSFFLIIAGVWAAYELREIGSLSESIKWLRRIRKALCAETEKLSGQVTELNEETQELIQNVDDFANENDELTKSVSVFGRRNNAMTRMEDSLGAQVWKLKRDVAELSTKEMELRAINASLKEQEVFIGNDLAEFSHLSDTLRNNTEQQHLKISEIIRLSNKAFAGLNNVMHEADCLVFWKRYYMIRKHCGEKFTERYFSRFRRNISHKFGDIEGLTFRHADNDNDGYFGHDDACKLLDELIARNQQRTLKRIVTPGE